MNKNKNKASRIKVTVYFDPDVDNATKKWLNESRIRNQSREIASVIIKYVNGELIEKQEAEREKAVLEARLESYKEIINNLMLANNSSTNIKSPIVMPNGKSEEAKDSNKVTEAPANTAAYSHAKETNKGDMTALTPNNINPTDEGQAKDDFKTNIAKYKDGRNYTRRGKGLADLQL
jgi:hypothetical protein